MTPFLEIQDLRMHFPIKGGFFRQTLDVVKAVDEVNLTVKAGETVGLVGESGCGKSTLARCVTRLYQPTSGKILFEGKDITQARGSKLKQMRRDIQMIFQDPGESMNPRMTVQEILEEPLLIHGIGDRASRNEKIRSMLDRVGLPSNSGSRYSFEFSGGQRQRIGIARALMLNPKLVICDEPVSALDVSVQSQVLNLLVELQREHNLTYLFIAHNLAVVRHVSDRVAVMYYGKIVELADADAIIHHAQHPYTQTLISAIPQPDPSRRLGKHAKSTESAPPSKTEYPDPDTTPLREVMPNHWARISA